MKNKFIAIMLALTLLMVAAPGFASDDYAFIHGVIVDKDGTSYFINEDNHVRMTYETLYYDSRERPLKSPYIAVGEWLYVEGTIERGGVIEAEGVYILPGYISKSERHRYPFIQIP